MMDPPPEMLDVPAASPIAPSLPGVIEALPGPVIIVGEGTRVVLANAAARQVIPALRTGDALAFTLRDPGVLDAIARVMRTGTTETVPWRDRVPVERMFELTLARLKDEASLLVLSFVDLTAARQLERMRTDFIANASHELRTPLASLLGFIETLQGPAREDTAARERFLAIMGEQARRMARLVDDLLSLSRIEQRLHLRPGDPVDLATVVGHVADTLAPLAAEKGVALTLEAEATLVTGDRDELIRIAENLIENAIKYGCVEGRDAAAPPCRVEVSVTRSRRDGVLVVRDYGPGIAAHHLPRLTERFYRIDAGQSRAKGGTGLGLALVKHIVARHRGRMTVDSKVGQGTTFTTTIPLHPGDAAGTTEPLL